VLYDASVERLHQIGGWLDDPTLENIRYTVTLVLADVPTQQPDLWADQVGDVLNEIRSSTSSSRSTTPQRATRRWTNGARSRRSCAPDRATEQKGRASTANAVADFGADVVGEANRRPRSGGKVVEKRGGNGAQTVRAFQSRESASTSQISLPPAATGCPERRMVSSRGGASGRRRGGVRMPAPDRSTPASPWCCEPVGRYGAGACGAVDCCLEREPQSRTWRPLRSGVSCRLGKEARDGRRR
jgi:hypothetical protein